MNRLIVKTATGKVLGISQSGVAAFRGIPYAASPIGDLRFSPPQKPLPWQGERAADQAGPAVPQGPSRLELVMGGRVSDWAEENCLTLNVWMPKSALNDNTPRPVLLWLHGGGFSSGSGGWDWYDGARLAELGNIVAVTANYRIGPLGYLWLPEIGAENLGSQDQIAALRWVHENIASFGGDPGAITVAGQSAGAFSATQLALNPQTSKLIRRLITQSNPWSLDPQDPALAEEMTRDYLNLLKIDAPYNLGEALRELPIEELLSRYSELALTTAGPGSIAPPMYPVAGGVGMDFNWQDSIDAGILDGKEILIGSTRDEMTAFFAFNQKVQALNRTACIDLLTAIYGESALELYQKYESEGVDSRPAEILTAVQTEAVFRSGVVNIGDRHTARGNQAYLYQWDFQPKPDPDRLGATHCGELPFLFGTFDSYRNSPMLGAEEQGRQELWQAFAGSLARFVAEGNPAGTGQADWAPHKIGAPSNIRHFD